MRSAHDLLIDFVVDLPLEVEQQEDVKALCMKKHENTNRTREGAP